MESVCRDLKKAYEQKIPIVPVSVNFSRLDFEMFDLVEEIGRILEKYGRQEHSLPVVFSLFLFKKQITENLKNATPEKNAGKTK